MNGRTLFHAACVLIGIDQSHTQCTPEERLELVSHLPGAKTIVEIGVYEGATTALLADSADSDATVYGIDPFFSGRLGICWSKVVAHHVCRDHRAAGKVVFIRKLSHEAAADVPDLVDFMFIDGDHSLAGIRRDWEVWASRMRPGGVIALHDSFPAPESEPTLGSHRFYSDVIALDGRFEEIGRKGSLAVLRRSSL